MLVLYAFDILHLAMLHPDQLGGMTATVWDKFTSCFTWQNWVILAVLGVFSSLVCGKKKKKLNGLLGDCHGMFVAT